MANANGARRVVVTGMGVVTPIGLNVPDFWASMQAAKCGVTELTGFPLEDLKILIAAQIKDFDPKQRLRHFQRDKLVMHADRYSWFAAAAADEAVKQAGLDVPFTDPYRSACIVGSGAGGLVTFENSYRALFIEGKRATHPLTLLRIIGSASSSASRVRPSPPVAPARPRRTPSASRATTSATTWSMSPLPAHLNPSSTTVP